jgi:hypothetical protein
VKGVLRLPLKDQGVSQTLQDFGVWVECGTGRFRLVPRILVPSAIDEGSTTFSAYSESSAPAKLSGLLNALKVTRLWCCEYIVSSHRCRLGSQEP